MEDYDRVVLYILHNKWEDLFMLMLRTNDDLLARKIRLFLHEYHYSANEHRLNEYYDNLIDYVDHATSHFL